MLKTMIGATGISYIAWRPSTWDSNAYDGAPVLLLSTCIFAASISNPLQGAPAVPKSSPIKVLSWLKISVKMGTGAPNMVPTWEKQLIGHTCSFDQTELKENAFYTSKQYIIMWSSGRVAMGTVKWSYNKWDNTVFEGPICASISLVWMISAGLDWTTWYIPSWKACCSVMLIVKWDKPRLHFCQPC